jgi:hypothetical protein
LAFDAHPHFSYLNLYYRMTRLYTTLLILALILSHSSMGQSKPLLTKKVFDTALLREKGHPAEFYASAGSFYQKGDKFEAAFLFYLGQLRYRYYVNANPEVTEDGDKAILASLNSIYGEEINFYLGGHLDKYIVVLDSVLAWDKRHEFEYFPKKKNPAKHKEILDGLLDFRKYILKNKDEIAAQHAEEVKNRK